MKGIKTLQADLNRGVKVIRDKNYNEMCNGVTKFSVNFFQTLVKKNILNADKVVQAVLKYHKKHWYSLTLKTSDGLEFSFYGVSFGYGGEGSRGSKTILDECNFKNTERVFDIREHFESEDKIYFYKRK